MSHSKKREPKKARSLVILGMILAGKGEHANVRLRDKRERRPKDARRQREQFQE